MRTIIRITLLLLMAAMTAAAFAAEDATSEATTQVVKQLALRCMTNIKSELVALSNRYPAFRNVGRETIDVPKPSSKSIAYGLRYWHQVHYIDRKEVPDENGILLAVGIREHGPNMPITQRFRAAFGKRRVTAFYRLEPGRNMKTMEAPVQAVLERHLRYFCDQVQRLK